MGGVDKTSSSCYAINYTLQLVLVRARGSLLRTS